MIFEKECQKDNISNVEWKWKYFSLKIPVFQTKYYSENNISEYMNKMYGDFLYWTTYTMLPFLFHKQEQFWFPWLSNWNGNHHNTVNC